MPYARRRALAFCLTLLAFGALGPTLAGTLRTTRVNHDLQRIDLRADASARHDRAMGPADQRDPT